MFFQRINRTDPEKVFVVAKSAYTTASLTAGNVVIWAYNGTDDGTAVTIPATAKFPLAAGVVAETIANGQYGLIQVYGHNTDTLVAPTLATALAIGDKLMPVNAAFTLTGAAAAGATLVAAESGLFLCAQVNASDTSVARARRTFIRCM